MKILIVFDWFLKLVVEGQARALRDLGHDVRLLCRDHALEYGGDATERSRALETLRAAGVKTLTLPGRRFGPEGIVSTIRARRSVAAWSPDVVSAHANDDPRLLFASSGYPLAYTVHDPEPHPGASSSRRERLGAALWLRSADQIVVQGHSLVATIRAQRPRAAISVIPHGIHVAACPLPVPLTPTILLFGRLEPYKGVLVLVEAMRAVWKKRPDARLLVAGTGPAAAQVPQDPRIELRDGYVPESDVEGLLSSATVAVLPYTQASQSGVGLLAIANGVPTVVTRTGALPEIAPGEAYIAEPSDPQSLAVRLLATLDAGLEERHRVLAFARRNFAWPIVARSYLELYEDLIRQARP